MKLSKQERIGALVILAIVILALGAFLLIKPKFESAASTKETLAAKLVELKDAQDKAARKGPLRDQILEAYKEGEHLADMFFPELKDYEADNALREFLLGCTSNVVVEEVEVGEPETGTLSASFYAPATVEYALKTYATQGVEATEEEAALQARQAAIMSALSNSQEIGASTVSFTVRGLTNEDLIAFCDEVNTYTKKENDTDTRKAIMLNGMSIEYDRGPMERNVTEFYSELASDTVADIQSGAGYDAIASISGLSGLERPEAPVTGEGGDTTTGYAERASAEDYYYEMDAELVFYSIERMQDPTAQLDAQDGI